jgi:hypothetical protein
MAMIKGFIALIVVAAVVVSLWYYDTGGKPALNPLTATTSIITLLHNTTTVSTTVIPSATCGGFSLFTTQLNTTLTSSCYSEGGQMGIWVSGGVTGKETVKIMGESNNAIYVNQTSNYQCITFFDNLTLPKQYYNVSLTTGKQASGSPTSGGNCYYAYVGINSTVTPPPQVYEQVFNGGFSNGKYTGWTVNGPGFGTAPLNITYSETANVNCYLSAPWSNYNGTYFATTFNCGLTNAPGNITSSLFYATQPFLNFQVISPADRSLYLEVLYNQTPYITAWYNTYNISASGNSPSTFQNASIPLINVLNKPIQIKVVAGTLATQRFIAVGNFRVSNKPSQTTQPLNITFGGQA